MSEEFLYTSALSDFQTARQKASIEGVLARITGKSTKLLSYEEVRQKLRAIENNKTVLRDIPLDSIIGSVGRNKDFSRSFLPLFDNDKERWARVMAGATGLAGLPPIDVYQIGEVFFVLDGNHRVSVARQLEAPSIQAYVREVRTRVAITPDTQPDDLIVKIEELDFFEKTQLDKLKPDSNFSATNPGQYPILLEHIEVHRYFMGLDEKRDISYEEAVLHWHDEVYAPIIQIIEERGILRHFPQQKEADLYLWISKHRVDLENTLNWQIDAEEALGDLEYHFTPEFSQRFSRLLAKIYDALTPDALESGPAPGLWREEIQKRPRKKNLFSNILVLASATDKNWLALEQSIILAEKETGQIQGLHVVKRKAETQADSPLKLKSDFEERCKSANIKGTMAIQAGAVARIACERSHWTDIIVTKVSFPPGDTPVARYGSGLRTMLRRCPRPMLVVRDQLSNFNHALLSYNGTPKSKEALYLAAYLGNKWGIKLSALVIEHEERDTDTIYADAHEYFKKHNLPINLIHHKKGIRSEIILKTAQENHCDFILMGGYKSSSLVEVVLGSVVDEVLRQTEIPLLICR
ncbi:MAG: universal stress protein [Anaerolineae bacterium]|jgi:nucleotide-binding universal stress UspA family protein|nr:universal stress protein [Anaerolineae bacterium]MBT7075059.1 universal stress protein [Anaerolineae bacterium]MBT7781892.1 universal stress protein [Anaerolineae bacterium]